MCTENAYCLEDRTLSPIPLCVCLKGYFRSDNGSCIKYAKFGESCEPYPQNRLPCEPDTGLRCHSYTCKCEPDHDYDPVRDLCIAKVGHKCSRTLNNCGENADCAEKTWMLDHLTGTTKMTGYICGCKPGLKITPTGLCASDYGGTCNKTSDCFPGEHLTCLNSICQCHPLSQIFSKKQRRCFNLVGTKCQPQETGGDKNGNSLMKNASRTNSKISSAVSAYFSSLPFTNSSSSSTTTSSTLRPPPQQMKDEEQEEHQQEMDGTEGAECISNSECVSTAHGYAHCSCSKGSSETMIKTCLLDYGQSCQKQEEMQNEIQSRAQIFVLEKEMKCNVFEGLICHDDTAKCGCADPLLVYDEGYKACVARIGSPCGNLKLGMLDLSQDIREMIFINCEKNSTCLELSGGGGMSKRVCVPFNKSNALAAAAGTSLSKLMFNNANVITATD